MVHTYILTVDKRERVLVVMNTVGARPRREVSVTTSGRWDKSAVVTMSKHSWEWIIHRPAVEWPVTAAAAESWEPWVSKVERSQEHLWALSTPQAASLWTERGRSTMPVHVVSSLATFFSVCVLRVLFTSGILPLFTFSCSSFAYSTWMEKQLLS